MSVHNALHFIQHAGDDPSLRCRIEALGMEAMLDHIVAFGKEAGFLFTPDEFRRAFVLDWKIRRRYYAKDTSVTEAG